MTPMALKTLEALPKTKQQERVFPINANAIRLAWERLNEPERPRAIPSYQRK